MASMVSPFLAARERAVAFAGQGKKLSRKVTASLSGGTIGVIGAIGAFVALVAWSIYAQIKYQKAADATINSSSPPIIPFLRFLKDNRILGARLSPDTASWYSKHPLPWSLATTEAETYNCDGVEIGTFIAQTYDENTNGGIFGGPKSPRAVFLDVLGSVTVQVPSLDHLRAIGSIITRCMSMAGDSASRNASAEQILVELQKNPLIKSINGSPAFAGESIRYITTNPADLFGSKMATSFTRCSLYDALFPAGPASILVSHDALIVAQTHIESSAAAKEPKTRAVVAVLSILADALVCVDKTLSEVGWYYAFAQAIAGANMLENPTAYGIENNDRLITSITMSIMTVAYFEGLSELPSARDLLAMMRRPNTRHLVAQDEKLYAWINLLRAGTALPDNAGVIESADTAPPSMAFVCSAIDAWTRKHDPALYADFRKPVSSGDLIAFNSAFNGHKLPKDYIAFLNIHDGQTGNADWNGPNAHGERILSAADVIDEYDLWEGVMAEDDDPGPVRADRGVKAEWWHDGLIPVAERPGGNYVCIDMAPAPGGTVGQIVVLYHDDGHRPCIAKTFTEWLMSLAVSHGVTFFDAVPDHQTNPMIWKYVSPKAAYEDFNAFERHVAASLPRDYAECVKRYGGARPMRSNIRVGSMSVSVQKLLSLSKTESPNAYATYDVLIGEYGRSNLVPFMNTDVGDLFCFDVKGANAVVFWSHEDNRVQPVKETFADFLNALT